MFNVQSWLQCVLYVLSRHLNLSNNRNTRFLEKEVGPELKEVSGDLLSSRNLDYIAIHYICIDTVTLKAVTVYIVGPSPSLTITLCIPMH